MVRRCHELSGQQLFLYLDENGEERAVCPHDVNAYLHGIAGEPFSAKHFRTWAAGVIAFDAIHGLLRQDDAALTVKNIVAPAAEALGDTPAVSRASYIHPALIDVAKGGQADPRLFLDLPRRRNIWPIRSVASYAS
jgi:DNA topoisomerase-1